MDWKQKLKSMEWAEEGDCIAEATVIMFEELKEKSENILTFFVTAKKKGKKWVVKTVNLVQYDRKKILHTKQIRIH